MTDNTNSIKTKSILGFLMLLNILNIVVRNLLSSFGPQIVEDLQLTDSQFGLLTGFLSDWLRTSGSEQPLTWAVVTTDIISLLTVPSFIWASVYIVRQQKQNVIDNGLK